MSVSITRNGNVLKIVADQDAPGKDFEEAAKKILDEKGVELVSLDLKNCYYIQSKAIAALIAFKKNSAKVGADFVVSNVCENIYQVFEMANLTSYFTINEDFSSFTADELIEKFFQPDYADRVSDYIAENYTAEMREKLMELMDTGDPEIRYYAILTIGKAHDYASEERIKKELDSEYPMAVKAAVLVLGWFGDTDSKAKIYEVLESGLDDLAEAAAASIALLSDETDAAKLGMLLKNHSKTIRTAAIHSLTLINDDKSFELLKGSLDTEHDDEVKASVIRAISSFNRAGVSDILIKGLDNASIKVREASASGLAKIKAKDKLADILKRVTDNDAWVGYFAVKACGEICSVNEASQLMDSYDEVDENVKLAIIEALGKIPADFSDFYMKVLDDSNEDIRKEVLGALFNDNKEYAKSAALTLLENDPSWLVRYKSLEILDALRPEGLNQILSKQMAADNNKYVKEKIQAILETL